MSCRRRFLFLEMVIKASIFTLIIAFNTAATETSEAILLNNQVQQLLKVENENIGAETVTRLSEKILHDRQSYSNDVIAKVFLLSAIVASNQGDINKVYKFAKEGLSVNSLDKTIRSSLSLKIAEVYVAKKQYQQLLSLTQRLIAESYLTGNVKHKLLALSYQSVAFSMLGSHQQALDSIQQVELGISNSAITEHIELLTILALANHYLNDYQTSLTMQLKILKLRFELEEKYNIDKTYLYLGYAYFYLDRFDDAYNAFWEAINAATEKGAPIIVAQAEKGLGLVLLTQNRFEKAQPFLTKANNAFKAYNMMTEYIEGSVALVKVKLELNHKEEAYLLLNEIISRLNGNDISLEYSGYYRLVADMYFNQKDYERSYQWLMKHNQILYKKFKANKKASNLVNSLPRATFGGNLESESMEASKRIALKLAENSELSSSFIGKFQKQQMIIIVLLIVIFLLTLFGLIIFIRSRAHKINQAYEEIEKPSYAISGANNTKLHYQLSFKKARNFQYPLSVGYLVITNWQELLFHFNTKAINEVKKEIASVINEHVTEFSFAGLLNDDEYLLLFEHQDTQEVSSQLDKLIQSINTRAFANLGDFSLIAKYSLNSPGFKDIDPYLFLARMTESVKVEQVN